MGQGRGHLITVLRGCLQCEVLLFPPQVGEAPLVHHPSSGSTSLSPETAHGGRFMDASLHHAIQREWNPGQPQAPVGHEPPGRQGEMWGLAGTPEKRP